MRAIRILNLTLLLLMLIFPIHESYASDTSFTKRKSVKTFIKMMVKKHHFKRQELITLLSHIKIRQKPSIKKRISKPLESEPWDIYQMLFISEWRIAHGVKFWNKHAETLKKAEKIYGVPAAIIVATLGIETKYGQRIGGNRVIDTLGYLAFNHSRRSAFFRKELESFLLLTRKHHLDPLKIMGSCAGAIGQPQFMPSSYLQYAINFSKSGKVDLIHNEVDAIGSIANYYQKHGWMKNQPVAVRAYLTGKRYDAFIKAHKKTKERLQGSIFNNNKRSMTVAKLGHYGIIPKYKASEDDALAKVIELPSRSRREYWLSFHNFDVIKRYNSSNLYAMAVYQLSNYIAELREKLKQ